MRAVERTPWAERRSSMHDTMCLIVSDKAEKLIRLAVPAVADFIGDAELPKSIDRVTVEAPCGTGFCDVLIETDGLSRAWFVEVKTEDERYSMGDVIRQLRWYAAQRAGFEERHLILVCEKLPDPRQWTLLLRAGVRAVPIWALERTVEKKADPEQPTLFPEYPYQHREG